MTETAPSDGELPALEGAGEPPIVTENGPEPDQAWKALSLVNDWIKHADAKVGATLAVSGVVAIMLYNLVKSQHEPGFWLSIFTVLCAVAVAAAGGSAALALMPRVTLVSRWQHKRPKGARAAKVAAQGEPQEDPSISSSSRTSLGSTTATLRRTSRSSGP